MSRYTMMFAVLALALLAGCAREQKAPATASAFNFGYGDPVAQAEASRQARNKALLGAQAEPRSAEQQSLDVDALTACIANAVKANEDPAKCNCIRQALASHDDPANVCAQKSQSADQGKAKDESEDEDDEYESSAIAPSAPAGVPMYVGFVGATPPPGWSSATGFKFEPGRMPRELTDTGAEVGSCDMEFQIDGRPVVWLRGASRKPLLVPVPEGAGLPQMPGLTSVLPRGETGYVLLSAVMTGGRIVPVPTSYGKHDAGVRCWRYDVGLANPGGRPVRTVTATLVKERTSGVVLQNNSSGREEIRNYFFNRPRSSAPTTPLWQG